MSFNHKMPTLNVRHLDHELPKLEPRGLDPDFGDTVLGGSTTSGSTENKYASRFQMGAIAGTLDSMSIGVAAQEFETTTVRAVIYADNAGEPDALVGYSSDTVVDDTATFKTCIGFGTINLTANAYYWLGFHLSGNWTYYWTAEVGRGRFNADVFAGGPSDPFGAATSVDKRMSAYATYTEAGGRIARLVWIPQA